MQTVFFFFFSVKKGKNQFNSFESILVKSNKPHRTRTKDADGRVTSTSTSIKPVKESQWLVAPVHNVRHLHSCYPFLQIPVMVAVAVRKKNVSIGDFSPSFYV